MMSVEADFPKQLVTANHTHTWWYNVSPLTSYKRPEKLDPISDRAVNMLCPPGRAPHINTHIGGAFADPFRPPHSDFQPWEQIGSLTGWPGLAKHGISPLFCLNDATIF